MTAETGAVTLTSTVPNTHGTRLGVVDCFLSSILEMTRIKSVPAIILSTLAGLLLFCAVLANSGSAGTAVSGAKLWVARYNGPASRVDAARALAVSGDGTKVFVTGASYGNTTTQGDYATLAYNASTGGKVWVARYNGPGNSSDQPSALAVNGDGTRVFVTGESYGGKATGYDYATVAYNAYTGAKLWVARYGGNGTDAAYSLAVSPDATKVYVTGTRFSSTAANYDYATVAYSASTGLKLWDARYNGYAFDNDYASSLAVSRDGTKLFVTGTSDGLTSYDYATVAYKASTGAKLWVARYNGPGGTDHDDDYAYSLAVSRDGTKVVVTGYSYGSATTDYDYATVAYNASTGAKLWVARYNGPGSRFDAANALNSIALSSDGTRVFVTGQSDGGTVTAADYATVAYNASTGGKLWVARYNGPASGYDLPSSVGVNSDGTKVFVTGESYGGTTTNSDYATVVYNGSTGGKLWVARYNGPGSGADIANRLSVSGKKVFVTGESYGGTTSGDDYATLSYQS
jgi:hypothetical protein